MDKILLIFLFALLAGCSTDLKVEIECDGRWSGYIHDASYDGYGNQTIDPSGSGILVAVVQKESSGNGQLTVKIIDKGWIIKNRVVDEATTTASYGMVTVSSY